MNILKCNEMKIRFLYVYIGLFILTLTACSDDDGDLSPSLGDQNWWEIKDNPDSELDHLIYEVYKESGISIFYNDTIGREVRTDDFGNKYNYYKIIDIDYNIENRSTRADYELADQDEQKMEGVWCLRDHVIPRLIPGMRPRCFLMVGYLRLNPNNASEDCIREGSVYHAMEATVVGRLRTLADLSEQERDRVAAEILAAGIANYIYNHESAELEMFYNMSTVIEKDNVVSMYDKYVDLWYSDELVPEYYGFLSSSWYFAEEDDMYKTPLYLQDITQYVTEVMLGDDEAFMQKYASYEVVRKKYQIMQKIVLGLQSRSGTE